MPSPIVATPDYNSIAICGAYPRSVLMKRFQQMTVTYASGRQNIRSAMMEAMNHPKLSAAVTYMSFHRTGNLVFPVTNALTARSAYSTEKSMKKSARNASKAGDRNGLRCSQRSIVICRHLADFDSIIGDFPTVSTPSAASPSHASGRREPVQSFAHQLPDWRTPMHG